MQFLLATWTVIVYVKKITTHRMHKELQIENEAYFNKKTNGDYKEL